MSLLALGAMGLTLSGQTLKNVAESGQRATREPVAELDRKTPEIRAEEGQSDEVRPATGRKGSGKNADGHSSLSAEAKGGGGADDQVRGERSGYRIGSGDVLAINVWREPEASIEEVVVRRDGEITLPLVKEIVAEGLTPSELEWLLAEAFGRFIRKPNVTVLVRQINSEKVFVMGAVRTPGRYQLRSPTTVLQAITEAGGLIMFAKKKKIFILRSNGERVPFDYSAAMNGDPATQKLLVEPGDTIVVP